MVLLFYKLIILYVFHGGLLPKMSLELSEAFINPKNPNLRSFLQVILHLLIVFLNSFQLSKHFGQDCDQPLDTTHLISFSESEPVFLFSQIQKTKIYTQISVCVFSFFSFCIRVRRWGWKNRIIVLNSFSCVYLCTSQKFTFLKEYAMLYLGEFQFYIRFFVTLFILFLNIMSKIFMTGCSL